MSQRFVMAAEPDGSFPGKVAKQMGDDWIAGTANASYEVKGPCTGEFWQSAVGTLQVDVRDGALPHVLLGTDTGVTITRFDGRGSAAGRQD